MEETKNLGRNFKIVTKLEKHLRTLKGEFAPNYSIPVFFSSEVVVLSLVL